MSVYGVLLQSQFLPDVHVPPGYFKITFTFKRYQIVTESEVLQYYTVILCNGKDTNLHKVMCL